MPLRIIKLEIFLTDLHGRGVRLRGRLALDAGGHMTALEVTYDADLGAYVSPVSVIANIHNPLASLTGCYAIPAAHASFRLVLTNADYFKGSWLHEFDAARTTDDKFRVTLRLSNDVRHHGHHYAHDNAPHL